MADTIRLSHNSAGFHEALCLTCHAYVADTGKRERDAWAKNHVCPDPHTTALAEFGVLDHNRKATS